jgi:hypothetical protein
MTNNPPVGCHPSNRWVLSCDGWRVVDDDYCQSVGKLETESMMSTTASLFPQLETKVYRSGEEQTND